MVYNFLGKDEKTQRNLYLLCLKHHCGKEVGHFSIQCIQTKTTTTHPDAPILEETKV